MTDLAELLARARQRDPEAAAALADLVEIAVATPDRRIGAAFQLKRRGGDPRAEQRRRRDEAVCALHKLTGEDRPLDRLVEHVVRFGYRRTDLVYEVGDFAVLLDCGYSADDIRKILGGNLIRVFRDAERVSREMQAMK